MVLAYLVYDPDGKEARAARLSLQRRMKARRRRPSGAPPRWVQRLVNWALRLSPMLQARLRGESSGRFSSLLPSGDHFTV